jgi:acetoin utilization deacetylase AcuC-like enzyme
VKQSYKEQTMIIYNPNVPASLFEFGIQIPIHDSRTTRTFAALKQRPELDAILRHRHRDHIDVRLAKEDLRRVHTPDYVAALYSPRLEEIITTTYELIDDQGNYYRYDPATAKRPLTDLFERTLTKASGTSQCAGEAIEHGFCYYFSGGMHHAHADHGSGFCIINDVAIAARKMQAEKGVKKVWIIDTDAHKGDGTAATTTGDDTIVTLSIHMAQGWPLDAPPILPDGIANPAYTPSDIDIPIESGEEPSYLDRLDQGLKQMAASGPADLAIVVSGADPFEKDELPSTAKLNLTLEQLMARDQMVYNFLKARRTPIAFLMAGGYGDEVWKVFSQFLTWVLPREYPDAASPGN